MPHLEEWTELPSGALLHKTTIQSRTSAGCSLSEAVSKPVRELGADTVAARARRDGLNPSYVQMRMREMGETYDQAAGHVRAHGVPREGKPRGPYKSHKSK